MIDKLQGIIDGQVKGHDASVILKQAVKESSDLLNSHSQLTSLIRQAEIFLVYGASGRGGTDNTFI